MESFLLKYFLKENSFAIIHFIKDASFSQLNPKSFRINLWHITCNNTDPLPYAKIFPFNKHIKRRLWSKINRDSWICFASHISLLYSVICFIDLFISFWSNIYIMCERRYYMFSIRTIAISYRKYLLPTTHMYIICLVPKVLITEWS